ncbi:MULTISPECIES: SymE family type I addiction module toxin [Yersinia pseudotuberculosis complex]|uniref:SymE family type I addiction module toxin n=1 Tax=Yersinia pseudotuberculosis complex TaxID=1649845 RepID=UPI0011A439D8|nr:MULTISPECIES: SymE family type I addiction module toxin [Yersinia pseudotuberculosis complex]
MKNYLDESLVISSDISKIWRGGYSLHINASWVRDNGELYLAGDWLTQCGLSGKQLTISVMSGQAMIRVQ